MYNGRIGPTELAAVSLGNSLFFYNDVFRMIFHCNTPMAAQTDGRKNIEEGHFHHGLYLYVPITWV
jgi:hypothetical protein